ncbi:MAG: DUF7144 family membrane protein [Ilumatobacteraceae bacterium]
MTDSSDQSAIRTSGWVVFAGSMIAIAAVANLIYGIVLLINDEWVVLAPRAVVTFDLTTVAVMYLIFSALMFFIAMGVFHGDLWARILGIVVAAFNLIAQMAFMSIYPAWSWLVIIVNGLIIYGLAVHGDEIAEL